MYFAKFTSFKKNNLKFVTTRITLVKNLGICCWEKNVTLSWLIFPLVSLKFTNLLSWLNFHLFFWSSFWQILLNYFSLLWIFIGFMAIYHLTCGYVLWCGLIRLLLLSHFSRVRPCAPPQTAAHEAPPALRFSGKSTGVGCPFLLQCVRVKRESEVAQSCPTLGDPTDRSPPGSSVPGISQARLGYCSRVYAFFPCCDIHLLSGQGFCLLYCLLLHLCSSI